MTATILVLSARPEIVGSVERCAAAVGARVTALARADGVRQDWRSATAIVVGDDLVLDLADVSPVHRPHVIVVADEPDVHWRETVALGAVGLLDVRDESGLLTALAAASDGHGEACLVAIIGACGGIGASTFTAALGERSARRGARSLALDADPVGGGLDLAVGTERAPGLRWHEIDPRSDHLAASHFAASLPSARDLAVLSFDRATPRPPGLPVAAVVGAAQRGFDLVAADVARHSAVTGDDLARGVLDAATSTIVLVPENVRGIAAAQSLLGHLATPVLAVATAARQGVGHREIERVLSVPVIARVPQSRAVGRSVDAGTGPGRARGLARAADRVLDAVGVGAT